MKRLLKDFCLLLVFLTGVATLGGCREDDLFSGTQAYDGEVTIDLDFEFEEMAEALGSRATPGNLRFDIENLDIFFYDAEKGETEAPVIVKSFERGDFTVYKDEQRPDTHCEEKTVHGKVKMEKIPGGTYRIYAMANVGVPGKTGKSIDEVTEKDLREIRINWPATVVENIGGTTAECLVPDAMFGYFTYEGVTDHTSKKYRNVVHHITGRQLYTNTAINDDKGKETDANRAKPITLDREHMEMQAWLKRVVSKLTIGYDGTALNQGISIYIKSVTVKDAAASCFLGHDNSVGTGYNDVAGDAVELLDNDTYARDNRFFLEYSSEEGATGEAITKATPAFPREGQAATTYPRAKGDNDADSNGWNDTWYESIHGSWSNPNPSYKQLPTTLYFLENLQGVATGDPKLQSRQPEDPDYNKDGKPNGTYIEVKAYYKNTNFGEEKEGNITYRFMLGKDIKNDFNAERNHHYKLTLSFVGDANDPDWHIELEKPEREEGIYFRIPYNLADNATDFNYTDKDYDEKWFTNENWKQSYVWYAYNEQQKAVAEIVKELVYVDFYDYKYRDPRNDPALKSSGDVKLRKFYQVVTVYPIWYGGDDPRGETDYSGGKIAQVLECDSENPGKTYMTKTGGAEIFMMDRDVENPFVANPDSYGRRGDCAIVSNELTPEIANGTDPESHIGYQYFTYNPKTEEIILLEAPLTTRLETRPWKVKDNNIDNNYYSIVKIGASYWFRENLKATHYSYPQTAAIDPYREGVSPKDNGEKKLYLHENARMYKEDGLGGKLYNIAALSGTADNNTPVVEQTRGSNYEICQRGTDYRDGDVLWSNEIDYQITPENWHIPTSYFVYDPGPFWEKHADHHYIMDFCSDNLARCTINKGNYQWPYLPDVTTPNLSGLSLLAIPADGSSKITFDLKDSNIKNGNLSGMCIPYWSDMTYLSKDDKRLYANTPFICLSDDKYYVTTTLITEFISSDDSSNFYKELNKQYLPVRPVRHASLRQPAAWSEIGGIWTGTPQR